MQIEQNQEIPTEFHALLITLIICFLDIYTLNVIVYHPYQHVREVSPPHVLHISNWCYNFMLFCYNSKIITLIFPFYRKLDNSSVYLVNFVLINMNIKIAGILKTLVNRNVK